MLTLLSNCWANFFTSAGWRRRIWGDKGKTEEEEEGEQRGKWEGLKWDQPRGEEATSSGRPSTKVGKGSGGEWGTRGTKRPEGHIAAGGEEEEGREGGQEGEKGARGGESESPGSIRVGSMGRKTDEQQGRKRRGQAAEEREEVREEEKVGAI